MLAPVCLDQIEELTLAHFTKLLKLKDTLIFVIFGMEISHKKYWRTQQMYLCMPSSYECSFARSKTIPW